MGGKPVQFGIDEECLDPVLAAIRAHPDALDFRGIHVYAGSQCFEPAGIVAGVQNCFQIARRIESSSGLRCKRHQLRRRLRRFAHGRSARVGC